MHWVWCCTWLWTWRARSVSPGSRTTVWRVTLEKVQPQHLNAIGEQIVATKQCQDKLIWPSPVPSYYFLRAKQPFRTICWKQNVPLLLGLEEKTNHPLTINTAAVSTNTKTKEHKPNCVSYFGPLSVSIIPCVIRAVSEHIFSCISHSGYFKKFFPNMPFCYWLKKGEG